MQLRPSWRAAPATRRWQSCHGRRVPAAQAKDASREQSPPAPVLPWRTTEETQNRVLITLRDILAAGDGIDGLSSSSGGSTSGVLISGGVSHRARLPSSAYQNDRPAGFCRNCCAPLTNSCCEYCGHRQEDDHSLLVAEPPSAEQQAAAAAIAEARSRARAAGLPVPPPTLLAFDEGMLAHHGLFSPASERPERLQAVMARLVNAGVAGLCEQLPARSASQAELLAVHSSGLLGSLAQLSEDSPEHLTSLIGTHLAGDAFGNRHTYAAATLAAGTAAEMAIRLAKREAASGFAVVRPPGHLASSSHAEAGNYVNSVAVAAKAAQRTGGASRVLIVDWDCHHGKGTQEIFYSDPSICVIDMHKATSGFWPGTGPPEESGTGPGKGRHINIAFQPPMLRDERGRLLAVQCPPVGDGDYITAFNLICQPVALEFRPDIIIVSAGFDAAVGDPVGQARLTPELFAHMTAHLQKIAPTMLVLEGGYNLKMTARCVELCVRALLGEQPPPLPSSRAAGVAGWVSALRTVQVHQQYWQCLALSNWMDMAEAAQSSMTQAGSSAQALGAGDEDEQEEEAVDFEPPARGSTLDKRVRLVLRMQRLLQVQGHLGHDEQHAHDWAVEQVEEMTAMSAVQVLEAYPDDYDDGDEPWEDLLTAGHDWQEEDVDGDWEELSDDEGGRATSSEDEDALVGAADDPTSDEGASAAPLPPTSRAWAQDSGSSLVGAADDATADAPLV